MVDVDRIIQLEEGQLGEEEIIDLFQDLIDTGQINHLQGSYQRTASTLVNAGYCTLNN